MGAVYVIAERLAVNDDDGYRRYLEQVSPTIEARGGRYHAVSSDVDALEGEWRPATLVVFEFPSREAALEWWSSEDYAPLKALRQASASYNIVLVPGLDSNP